MPPRRRQRANGPAGGAAAAQAAPLLALPPDVFDLIGQGLTMQDKLNNIASCVRDVASLAQTCKCAICGGGGRFASAGTEREMERLFACLQRSTRRLLLDRRRCCRTLRQLAGSTLWVGLGESVPAVGAATASKLPGGLSDGGLPPAALPCRRHCCPCACAPRA